MFFFLFCYFVLVCLCVLLFVYLWFAVNVCFVIAVVVATVLIVAWGEGGVILSSFCSCFQRRVGAGWGDTGGDGG